MKSSYYDTLGVKPDARPEDIKKAFRRRAKTCHPDHHDGDGSKEAEFKELAHAYNVLSDPQARRHYDATGNDRQTGGLDKKAQELLVMIFQQLRQTNGDRIFYADIIAAMTVATHNAEREAKENAGKLRAANKKINKLLKKLGHKKSGNQSILHAALNQEKYHNRMNIYRIREDILVFRRARLLLKDYRLRPGQTGAHDTKVADNKRRRIRHIQYRIVKTNQEGSYEKVRVV